MFGSETLPHKKYLDELFPKAGFPGRLDGIATGPISKSPRHGRDHPRHCDPPNGRLFVIPKRVRLRER